MELAPIRAERDEFPEDWRVWNSGIRSAADRPNTSSLGIRNSLDSAGFLVPSTSSGAAAF